jgi:outer membrane receptor for ferrienterochelin and colicins
MTRVFCKSSLGLLAALAAYACWIDVAHAEDEGDLLEVLEENVVSGASRSAERSSDAPAYSSVITGEQLRQFGIRRLDEALNFLSTGMFTQDRMSTAESGARGVSLTRDFNSHVLVVLDGMVMNEQGGGAVYFHDIPIELIDRVEVILGPGSVLYGAQAMLGVVNVVTKAPKDYAGYHAYTTFGASPPMNADGSFAKPTIDALGHDNRYAVTMGKPFRLFGIEGGLIAGVDYSDFKGPRIAFDTQQTAIGPNGTPVADYGAAIAPGTWGGPVSEQWFRRTTGGFARVDLGQWSWTTRATLTHAAMPQMDLFENRVGGIYDDPRNSNRYITALSNLRYSTRISERLTAMVRGYFGYSETRFSRFVLTHDQLIPGTPLGVVDPEQCPIGPDGPCRKDSLFASRWQGLELQSTADWFGDGAYTTMVGVDGRLRTSGYEFVATDVRTGLSYGSDPANTRWHGGGNRRDDEYAIGAYLQQVLRPTSFLTANAGVRVDYDSRIASKYLTDALSPRVALIAAPTDYWTVKAIYSTAFRAPSFLELYIVNGRLLPNYNGLQPESVASYELMTSLKSGAHTLTVGGFYANWKNLIELQIVKATAPSVSHYSNVSGIDNYGLNGSYEGAFFDRKFRVGLNVTAAQARRRLSAAQQDRDAEFGVGSYVPVTVAPKLYGNARASYQWEHTSLAIATGVFGPRIADQAYYGGDPSNLSPRPEAPTQVEIRTALTGDMPSTSAVGYTVGLNYAATGYQPYVIGPNQGLPKYLSPQPVRPELALVNRFTLFVGLEFHIDRIPEPAAEPAPSPSTAAPLAPASDAIAPGTASGTDPAAAQGANVAPETAPAPAVTDQATPQPSDDVPAPSPTEVPPAASPTQPAQENQAP